MNVESSPLAQTQINPSRERNGCYSTLTLWESKDIMTKKFGSREGNSFTESLVCCDWKNGKNLDYTTEAGRNSAISLLLFTRNERKTRNAHENDFSSFPDLWNWFTSCSEWMRSARDIHEASKVRFCAFWGRWKLSHLRNQVFTAFLFHFQNCSKNDWTWKLLEAWWNLWTAPTLEWLENQMIFEPNYIFLDKKLKIVNTEREIPQRALPNHCCVNIYRTVYVSHFSVLWNSSWHQFRELLFS